MSSVCEERFCSRKAQKGRRLCGKHRIAKWRKDHPMKACYKNLKDNAKRRGKFFDLTFEQFEKFAISVDLIKKRGRSSESYTVDRIDNDKGYTIENIQVLTKGANTIKRHRKLNYDWSTKYGSYMDIETGNEIHPF